MAERGSNAHASRLAMSENAHGVCSSAHDSSVVAFVLAIAVSPMARGGVI
jgi:hypothetical protein